MRVPIKKQSFGKVFWTRNKPLVAVDRVVLRLRRGESVALLGPNGAGKTTTLKMLSGLLYPSSGG